MGNDDTAPGSGDQRNEARAIALLGVLFSLLALSALLVFTHLPGPKASTAEIEAFRTSEDARLFTTAALTLLAFIAIAFIWWSAALRAWLLGHASSPSRMVADVQLGAGICFIALVYVAAAAASAATAGATLGSYDMSPDVERGMVLLGRTVLMIFGMRMAGLFVTTTAKLAGEAGVLPRWFRLLSYGVAAALFLVPSLSPWLVVVFPAWVLLLSGAVLRKTRPAER